MKKNTPLAAALLLLLLFLLSLPFVPARSQTVSDLDLISTLDLTLTDKLYLTNVEATGSAKDKSVTLSQLVTLFGPTIEVSGSNITSGTVPNARLDSDLSAIAALTTTTYGRSLLAAADAAGLRTLAGLGSLATQSGTFSGTHSGTSSGTNTGDQDLSGYAPLANPTFTGTINGAALSLSGGISVTGSIATGAGDFQTTVGNIATGSGVISGNGSGITNLNASNLASGTINSSRLAASGVTAGSYTNTSLTVDAAGRITAASSGTAAGSVNGFLPSTINWTGGAVYALNKLVPAYAGSAIRLIRASDSAQADFGFDGLGRFDVISFNSWVSGTTAKVVSWYDQSGNAYHANQSTDGARPEFKVNVYGQPVVFFRDVDFSPQLYLTLPSGVANNLINMTQITVARCVDEYQSGVSGPVWPSFGVGTGFSGFGASDGVIEITSASTTQGIYDRSLNGNPLVYLSIYPSTSRLEAVGFHNSGTGGSASDQRYITSTFRSPRTLTGSIAIWKNAGVAQIPTGGRLGARGDGGSQSQAEAVCMMLARGGSISQTEEAMSAIKQSFGLRPRPRRILWWCGDSLSAGYEGGYDFKGRAPGVLCDAIQDDYLVFTFAKAGKRFDQLDSDAASSTLGIDHWLTASETKMPKAADVFVLLGANDLNATANGGSAANLATIQSRCNAFISARKASGAARVFVGTIPAAGSYITTDSTRTDYNAWLMAGSSSADGVVDLAGLNWLGKLQGDGVHWTQEGNLMVARAVADFLISQN